MLNCSMQGSSAYGAQCKAVQCKAVRRKAVRRKAVRHMAFGAELFYKGLLRKIDFEEGYTNGDQW
ncbi:MAG: hypothetical protein RSB09_04065 [Clostridia bacterium]